MAQAIRPPSTPQLITRNGERVEIPPEATITDTDQAQYHGGGGGGGDGMLQRVEALERGMEDIKAVLKDQSGKIDKLTELVHGFGLKTSERLGTIEGRLTGIEKMLDAKAAKSDLAPIQEKVGSIDGTVRGLPGIAAMITLVISTVALSLGGAAGLAYALARYLKP